VIIAAAGAVSLFSLVGVGAVMGLDTDLGRNQSDTSAVVAQAPEQAQPEPASVERHVRRCRARSESAHRAVQEAVHRLPRHPRVVVPPSATSAQ